MLLTNLLKIVSLEKAALVAASRFTGLPPLEEELSTGHTVLLMLCDLLAQQQFEKDHQYAIIEVIKNDVMNPKLDMDIVFMGVQILDYKYITLPHWTRVYNYHTLEYIDKLPSAPVVSLCISLSALYRKYIKPLKSPT